MHTKTHQWGFLALGAIVAVVNKRGENAVPSVVAMLRELTHRGVDAHGVATPSSAITARSGNCG